MKQLDWKSRSAKSIRRSVTNLLMVCLVHGLVALAVVPKPSQAAEEVFTIVVPEGRNLRSLAGEYLGNPNLWQEILKVNQFESPNQVVPGIKLRIPKNEITLANRTLNSAQTQVQEATQAGARLFVRETINQAIELTDQAKAHCRQSEWKQCHVVASQAEQLALNALKEANRLRQVSAQAILKHFTGTVQSQKTSDLVWNNLNEKSSLEEREKVRTLSNSTATILFVDDSRLQLSENSQAVIQAMQVDRLSNKKNVKVSLAQGDVFALLGHGGQQKTMDLKVPGITMDSKSANFWMSRKQSTTKIANYDDEEMKVQAAGGETTLGKNQGTLVKQGQKPTQARDLLGAPKLLFPQEGQTVYTSAVTFAWEAVPGASTYVIELGDSSSFDNIKLRQANLRNTEVKISDLENGVVFWRVIAVDKAGFPGIKLKGARMVVQIDVMPPQLIVLEPAENAVVSQSTIQVKGTAEPNTQLQINSQPVPLTQNGAFEHPISLQEGANRIQLQLEDLAGNRTTLHRKVEFVPDKQAQIQFDEALARATERHFLTRAAILSLSGTTIAEARVEILSEQGQVVVTTQSDAQGRFSMQLPAIQQTTSYQFQVHSVTGFTTSTPIQVTQDTEAPTLQIQRRPPAYTANPMVSISGSMTGGNSLAIGIQPVQLIGERFSTTVSLRPGINRLKLVASDAVGNQAQWVQNVVLDQEPPRLVLTTVTPRTAKGGENLTIEIKAEDATAMKQTAQVWVKVAGKVKPVNLRLNQRNGIYTGKLRLTGGEAGNVSLDRLVLEDYAGNRKEFTSKELN